MVGLYERAGHLIYNTAALLAPDGQLAGKYRKVTLPRNEIADGVAPGHEYPVCATRFGASVLRPARAVVSWRPVASTCQTLSRSGAQTYE